MSILQRVQPKDGDFKTMQPQLWSRRASHQRGANLLRPSILLGRAGKGSQVVPVSRLSWLDLLADLQLSTEQGGSARTGLKADLHV